MCDEKLPNYGHLPYTEISRRGFAALAAAAGAAGFAGAAQAQAAVVEKAVKIRTPDGVCDGFVYYPAKGGAKPGALVWPDAGGLRQAMKDLGRRTAGLGYVALVVNPYYRAGDAATVAALDNKIPEQLKRRNDARPGQPDIAERDARAFVAWLDAQPQTSNAKVGVQGYCMGGALSVRTAAAVSGRIGAVCSFHGGNGLVTKDATSPHLLIGKTNARFLFAHAQNDDKTDPTVKGALREALYKAGRPGDVDVYAANHGWMAPDGQSYNAAESERGWKTLTDVYARSLV